MSTTIPQSLIDSIARHEQYAAVDPTNAALRLSLGDLYHQAGRCDDALHCYERCLAQADHSSVARSRMASVMITQHRFSDAEATLRGLLQEQPHNNALEHNLGLALYYQERFEEARELFAAVNARGLAAPSNYGYLARCHHHLGNIGDAIAAGTQWTAVAPGVASKSYLALLHIDGGDVKEALRLGQEVLAEDRENVYANVAVGSARLESQEADSARRCFEVALRHDPENGRAWLGLGLVHMYDQEPQQAIAALANATRIFPDNAGMAVTHGWAFIVAQDAAGAEGAFEKALHVDRTFSEAHAGYAAALALQGKIQAAQEALELARRLNRHSIGADIAESFLQAARGRQHEAGELFARMLKKTPRADILPLIDQLRIYTGRKRLPDPKLKH